MNDTIIKRVAGSYLETALWSSSDWDNMDESNNPTPFDENYDYDDFTDEARQRAYDDCEKFLDMLDEVQIDDDRTLFDCAEDIQGFDRIGHDFWLTRNHHGAGFWDGDYGDYGDILTDIVKQHFNECHVWADGTGKVYLD